MGDMADYYSYDDPTHPNNRLAEGYLRDFQDAAYGPREPEIARKISRDQTHPDDLIGRVALQFDLDRRVVKEALFSLRRDKQLRDKGVQNPSIIVFDELQLDQFFQAHPNQTFTLEKFGDWMSEGLPVQPPRTRAEALMGILGSKDVRDEQRARSDVKVRRVQATPNGITFVVGAPGAEPVHMEPAEVFRFVSLLTEAAEQHLRNI